MGFQAVSGCKNRNTNIGPTTTSRIIFKCRFLALGHCGAGNKRSLGTPIQLITLSILPDSPTISRDPQYALVDLCNYQTQILICVCGGAPESYEALERLFPILISMARLAIRQHTVPSYAIVIFKRGRDKTSNKVTSFICGVSTAKQNQRGVYETST